MDTRQKRGVDQRHSGNAGISSDWMLFGDRRLLPPDILRGLRDHQYADRGDERERRRVIELVEQYHETVSSIEETVEIINKAMPHLTNTEVAQVLGALPGRAQPAPGAAPLG